MTGQPNPTRGALRVCRGVALAVTSATLAIAAHRLAGGGDPPDTGLTIVLAFGVAGIGVTMAGKQRSVWAILAVLGVAQLATHVLLSVNTMDMPGMGPAGMQYSTGMQYTTGMFGAHAIAVLVTAAVLTKADAAVFAAAAALARLLPTLLSAPPVPGAPDRPLPRVAPLIRPVSVLLCRENGRRGPPVRG